MDSVKTFNQYKVLFSFTTWHSGSRMMNRNGEIVVQSEDGIESVRDDDETVKQLCINEIMRLRPTFKIFHIDITEITPYVSKKKVKK